MIKILAIDEAELTAQISSMIRLKKSENKVLLENELEERKQELGSPSLQASRLPNTCLFANPDYFLK